MGRITMALKETAGLYETLKAEWNKKNPNLSKCGDLLTRLKISLLEQNFLPTSGSALTKQQLILARDVLEIGALWSILKKDIPSFERYMAQLKCYYFDYKDELPESPYVYQLLGLNLMCLLAQNRLAEFHTELELLPAKELQENVYIRCPIVMEQHLMEGNYNKVFLTKGNVPAESYHLFINILLNTLRDEVAACVEKSYPTISCKEAMRMMFFTTEKEMKAYATKRCWEVNSKGYYIFRAEEAHSEDIPSVKLIEQFLGYAKELERIV